MCGAVLHRASIWYGLRLRRFPEEMSYALFNLENQLLSFLHRCMPKNSWR